MPHGLLLDRVAEQETLAHLLGEVRSGLSQVLVISGEPGAGKTAMLEHVVELAGDFRIVRVLGVESELALPLAGLHQLLVPFLARHQSLPLPQQQALRRAFGLAEGPVPERFLVGLAALTLVSEAAVEQPLLIVIDDAQWLDRESGELIAFVARRLLADRVALLFARRDTAAEPGWLDGLPELRIGGLPDADARALLASIEVPVMHARVRERLLAITGGNPLALIELAGALTPDELTGRARLRDPVPLGDRMEEHFLRQVRELPPETQEFLLLAAADPAGDTGVVSRAAAVLGLPEDAPAAAELKRLITLAPGIAFRHPLIRSAIYHHASTARRRRAHQALAAATSVSDADQRAWHLAAAAPAPDEEVAAELERSAGRARDRGGYAASAACLRRAAELTPDRHRAATRALAAAQAELAAGAPARALEMLEIAVPVLSDPFGRAQAARVRGAIHYAAGEAAQAAPMLLGAARDLEPFDPRLATEALIEALAAALNAGQPAAGGFLGISDLVLRRGDQGATVPFLLLKGFALRLAGDYKACVEPLTHAIGMLRSGDSGSVGDLRCLELGCWAAIDLLDVGACQTLARNAARTARASGALADLPVALVILAGCETVAGRLAAAEGSLAEAREISTATGNPGMEDAAGSEIALLLAWRGQPTEARGAIAAYRSSSLARGQRAGVLLADYATSVLELGLGNYAEALACVLPVFAEDPPALGTEVLPDLVESAVRAGDRAVAQAGLQRLAERADASGTELSRGLLARSRALVTDEDAAHAHYREAAEQLERSGARLELSRAHLLYGEWLRRQRLRRAAREQLELAHELFVSMGCEAFAERARMELLATGGHARRRDATGAPDSELTPREAQIASRVASGATNQEIAAQLFISVSTVDYHLRKVFRKLQVKSRTELARVMLAAGRLGDADLPLPR